jgi:riboflavin synthase
MGEIMSVIRKGNGARLSLSAGTLCRDAGIGDSISINGTCLTVVEIQGDILSFDLSDETLKSTNLGQLRVKDRVNLEPALRLDARLGGHFVTGHIDGVGKIRSKTLEGDVFKVIVDAPPAIMEYLVEKGSVAVDGISLTVVDVYEDSFSIVIIPHTAKLTTIGFKGPGDRINIEVDILGKYVSKFLRKNKDEKLMQMLMKEGFA